MSKRRNECLRGGHGKIIQERRLHKWHVQGGAKLRSLVVAFENQALVYICCAPNRILNRHRSGFHLCVYICSCTLTLFRAQTSVFAGARCGLSELRPYLRRPPPVATERQKARKVSCSIIYEMYSCHRGNFKIITLRRCSTS
jgi:hypothetical protein